jgi:hypothetical protein
MKLPSSLLLSLALAAGSLGHTSIARGADDPVVVQARARFKEGVTYFDAGKYDEARTSFLQAYSLKPHPAVLLNLAQSELRSNRPVDAATHFSDFLAQNPSAKPGERTSAEKGLAEAKQKVGELSVAVDATGAEVFVDGASIGLAPLERPVFVTPGEHLIEVKDGARSATTRVTSLAGGTATAHLTFPVPVAVEQPAVEPAPAPMLEPAAPPSEVGDSSRPPFFSWLVSSPVGLTGLGITAAGLGVGITGSIVATNKYNSAQDAEDQIVDRARRDEDSGVICSSGSSPSTVYAPACAERQDRLDSGDDWTTVAVIGYSTAAVAAAGTVVYYLVAAEPEAPPMSATSAGKVRLVPIVAKDVQALSLQGSF